MSETDYFYDYDGTYCHPDTDVLANKLGITDKERLERLETTVTIIRIGQLTNNPLEGKLDLDNLLGIHKAIFCDIYSWAGQIRSVEIAKGGFQFCRCEYMEAQLNGLFSELERENYLRGLDEETAVSRLAYYLGEMNVVHPFREGNGRTQRVFIEQLAKQAGHPLTFM